MFVDSHCHLDFPELTGRLPDILAAMRASRVTHALCVSVGVETFPAVRQLAIEHPNLYATAGVHPDHTEGEDPSVEKLCSLADHPRVVAIGETGLDYFRATGDLTWQRDRFRTHIRAAVAMGKPLVVHCRDAAEDTLRLLAEEGAGRVGGVMHCFTESLGIARRAIDLGFLISFSGIVTFRNAVALKEVARAVEPERMMIETDAPYLAPVPHRGKANEPAFVAHTAAEIAHLKGMTVEEIGRHTSRNFFDLFRIPTGSA